MAKTESSSDALARRIGGVLLLLVSLALVYGSVWLAVTRGHVTPTDLRWLSHFGSSGNEWVGPGGLGAAVGVLLVVVSIDLIVRRPR
jgi:hypothetical protein